MIEGILDLIADQSCAAQGSAAWYRSRLGCISSSNVHYLMLQSAEQKAYEKILDSKPEFKPSKVKFPTKATDSEKQAIQASQLALDKEKYAQTIDAWEAAVMTARENAKEHPFSDTCISKYLYNVASERNLQTRYLEDDGLFAEYNERVNVSTRAMRYGTENEDIAREIYQAYEKVDVTESGFIRHTDIPMYGDSPDGTVFESKKRIIAIEIKFPQPNTWISYADKIHSAEDLKEVKPEYYWQCMSHIECGERYYKAIGTLDKDGEVVCDFVFCDKMQKGGYRKIRIEANRDDIKLMKERVIKANEYIDNLLERIKQ